MGRKRINLQGEGEEIEILNRIYLLKIIMKGPKIHQNKEVEDPEIQERKEQILITIISKILNKNKNQTRINMMEVEEEG